MFFCVLTSRCGNATVRRMKDAKKKNVAVPERLHRKLKVSATRRGQKLVERVVEILERGLKHE